MELRRLILVVFAVLSLGAASPNSPIDCSSAALHAEIAAVNASCAADTITFNCSNATITLTPSGLCADNSSILCDPGGDPQLACPTGSCTTQTYQKSDRDLTCAGMTIDGESNNITIEMSPSCETDATARGGVCGLLEGADWPFRLRANNQTIKNLTLDGFGEGIHIGVTQGSGVSGATLDNLTLTHFCDDTVTNQENSENNTLSNSALVENCHRGIVLEGAPFSSENPADPDYYDLTVSNVTVTGVPNFFVVDDPGRWRFVDVTIDNDYDNIDKYEAGGGAAMVIDRGVLYLDNVTITKGTGGKGFKWNLAVMGTGQAHVTDSELRDGKVANIVVLQNGVLFLENTIIADNQGLSSGSPGFGGVAIRDGAAADLGGGSLVFDGSTLSSAGNNQFLDNAGWDPDLVEQDAERDVSNERTDSYTLKAEGSYWNRSAPLAGQVNGAVDYTPYLSAPPSGTATDECNDSADNDGDGDTDAADWCCDPAGGNLDTEDCCGDDFVAASKSELCDGTDLGTCTGGVSPPTCDCTSNEVPGTWTGGTLACNASCAVYDTSACTPETCGDGSVDGTEECDGTIVPNTCFSLDALFVEGLLSCLGTCLIDQSACSGVLGAGSGTSGSSVSGGTTR